MSLNQKFLTRPEVVELFRNRAPVLFLGNGPRTQYKNVSAVVNNFEQISHTLGGNDDWIAVFGGDTYVPEAPDLGAVMAELQRKSRVQLLAVVGWDDIDPHVNYAYRYASQKCEKTGRELYGGFNHLGDPVGGTTVYLSEWASMLRAVVAFDPRGTVGRAELAHAKRIPGLHVIEVPAEPKLQ